MQGLCNDSCNDMKRGQTKGRTVCIFKFMRKSILIYCIYICSARMRYRCPVT